MTQSNRQIVFVNFSNATTVDVQLPSEADDCELPYLVHNVGLAGEMVDTFKRLVERFSLTQAAGSNEYRTSGFFKPKKKKPGWKTLDQRTRKIKKTVPYKNLRTNETGKKQVSGLLL